MDPVILKQWNRFKANRRGYFSFLTVTVCFLLSLGSELICNNKPYIMKFEGQWYFPIFKFYPSSTFGDDISTETDYKALTKTPQFSRGNNFVLFPPVPYGHNESADNLETPPPTPPSTNHWLGTDDRGRDLLTRLIYGFRNSMLFALVSWLFICLIGYCIGAFQGYIGGKVDLLGQRIIEVWHALPILYVIIFLISIFPSSLILLLLVWVAFNWISLSGYIRAEVLRVRKQEYILAAEALGAATPRILFKHILKNTLTPILTLSPFIVSSSIASLAALDYLGLGLPPPSASWGELLRQGKENLSSWWLAAFPFLALFVSLLLLNFIGEAARSALDVRSKE